MHLEPPASSVAQPVYNIGPSGELTLDAWLVGPTPQCLVVSLPTTRAIGEDEFLLDLARYRCAERGFKDSLSRHFISRRFGVEGSPQEAEAFLDQARIAAEITDDFLGVDALDLTDWLSVRMAGERWHSFIRYMQTSPGTDFVLLVRTKSKERVEAVARTIAQSGCLMADVIELYAPTGKMLAQSMTKHAALPPTSLEAAASAFESMRALGMEPNYVLARDLALRVSNELRRGLGGEEAVIAAFTSRGITFGSCR